MQTIPYRYSHLPIPGGGYVTGFLFHPTERGLFYCRTDIGGAYRFDASSQTWVSLIPQVTAEDLRLTYPIALALDRNDPDRLLVACGVNRPGQTGALAVSFDRGTTFRLTPMPMFIHGNLNGRGTGERLIVDGGTGDRLYFASQRDGLWRSDDLGGRWTRLSALPETHLAFVAQVGRALIVATAGLDCRTDAAMRSHSLYMSLDGGESFSPMAEPTSRVIPGCRLCGLVAQRWSADSRYLYVTFSATGRRSYVLEDGYSCDSGDALDGRIVRYALDETGAPGPMEEITPRAVPGQALEWGYSGVAASLRTPGLLIASTIVRDDGDSIFLSRDWGDTWEEALHGLTVGDIRFRAPYMRPECNGGRSLIHWLSDLKLDPFDDDVCWFNTGTGVFRSARLTHDDRSFTDWCDGMEETVHLNVYSLPSGKTRVVDIVGDLGGFAFEQLDRPCANSFADADGNRYITCINADFSDRDPARLIVTPRGNWTGETKGGLILSADGGRSFRRLPMPFCLSGDIDRALHAIERPNVNSGWVAMSPDGRNIVWAIAEGCALPVQRVVVSQDGGETFERVRILDLNGAPVESGCMKPFADRMNSAALYGFGGRGELYASVDGGRSFRQLPAPDGFPAADFGLIDCANKTAVQPEGGRSGVFFLALGEAGLWTLIIDAARGQAQARRITAPGENAYCVGLGLGRPGGDYLSEPKALYVTGRIGGEYGFFRSLDQGATWQRINTSRQMYGQIQAIDGDCREFGRFYLATGSNGLLTGAPA